MTIWLPVKIISTANEREHWATKARRAKKHRSAALAVVRCYLRVVDGRPASDYFPGVVTLTRIYSARGKVMDTDNLVSGCKNLRDGVADALGIDDADPRVRWVYAQKPGKTWGVEIQIDARLDGG